MSLGSILTGCASGFIMKSSVPSMYCTSQSPVFAMDCRRSFADILELMPIPAAESPSVYDAIDMIVPPRGRTCSNPRA